MGSFRQNSFCSQEPRDMLNLVYVRVRPKDENLNCEHADSDSGPTISVIVSSDLFPSRISDGRCDLHLTCVGGPLPSSFVDPKYESQFNLPPSRGTCLIERISEPAWCGHRDRGIPPLSNIFHDGLGEALTRAVGNELPLLRREDDE